MKIIISSLLLSLLFACNGDKDDSNPEPEPAPLVAEDAAATEGDPSAAAEPAAEELPTAADFEQEVNQEITDENLEKELEELEKEIGE